MTIWRSTMDLRSIIEGLVDQFNRENYGAFYLTMRWRPMENGKRPPRALLIMVSEPTLGNTLTKTYWIDINSYRRHFYPQEVLRGIIQDMKGDLQDV